MPAGADTLDLVRVGDLVAKFTAIEDWELAFRQANTPVDDFAALLSDGSVHAVLARPILDEEGMRLLAVSLLFNGTAMEVCGSSGPASGSEHLISHALDEVSARPRLHGVQVGVATYLVSLLGLFLREKIEAWFKARKSPFVMRYFDPSSIIRSSPDNAEDTVRCDAFAGHAAHAAMAKTGMVIGFLHGRFIHVPIELLTTQQKRLDPDSPAWIAVLSATEQPHRFA